MAKSVKRRIIPVVSVAAALLLILVLAVVGPIAWQVLGNISKYKAKANVTKATHEVQIFRFACNLYASEHEGKYPATLGALTPRFVADRIGPDPWGKPYTYVLNEAVYPKICIVRSSGPDRTPQTSDDIICGEADRLP